MRNFSYIYHSGTIPTEVSTLFNEVEKLLKPLGVRVQLVGGLGQHTNGSAVYICPFAILWGTTVKSRSSPYDGCSLSAVFTLDWYNPRHEDAGSIACDILKAVYERLQIPFPELPEVDWRPTEVMPEDFYAA